MKLKTKRGILNRREIPLKALLFAAAFFIPALTALSIFASYGMYPFGEKSVLIMDMSGQYVEFLAGLKHIRSLSDIYFNWGKVLGGNYSGVFAYYSSSPLSMLTVFCPDRYLPAGILFLTVLKIGLCGLTMAVFLHRFLMRTVKTAPAFRYDQSFVRNIVRAGIVLLFSTLYALCSYNCVYSMCVMWLDGVIVLPLILYFTEEVVEKGRMAGLIASFAYIFIANYYVAFMCGVFSVIYLVFYLIDRRKTYEESVLDRSTRIRFYMSRIVRYVLSAALAAAISAFIVLPAFFSLLEGKIGGTNSGYPSDWNYSFTEFIRKLFIGEYDGITNKAAPFFYSGAAVAIGVPLFFMNRRIKARTRISAGVITVFLLFSTMFSELDNAWHIFQHPNWFPYRWTFVLTFFAVFLAFRGVLSMSRQSPGNIAGVIALLFALGTAAVKMKHDAPDPSHVRRQLTLVLIYSAIFICCSLVIKAKRKTTELKFKKAAAFAKIFAAGALSLILIAPSVNEEKYHWEPLLKGLDRAHHYEDASAYVDYRKEIGEVLTAIRKDMKEQGLTGFSGISRNFSRSYNEAIGLGYRSMAHYSSAFNRSVNTFLDKFGYSCAYLWNLDFGATAVTDSLFGMNYFLNGRNIYLWDEDELIETGSTVPPAEYLKIGSVSGAFDVDIYRNEYAVPGPFIMSGDPSELTLKGNYFSNQNELIKLCSGIDRNVFKQLDRNNVTVSLSQNVSERPDEKGFYAGSGGLIDFLVELPEGGVLYAYFPGYGSEGNPKLFVRDGAELSDPIKLFRGETNCIQRLGSAGPGEKISFTIEIARSVNTNGFMFYVLDTEALKVHMDAVKARALDITGFGTGRIKGRLPEGSTGEGGTMLIQVAYDQGWVVKADGKRVETASLADGLLTAVVPAGAKTVELIYRARGQTAGIVLSASALIFCALCIAAKIIKKRKKTATVTDDELVSPVDFQ